MESIYIITICILVGIIGLLVIFAIMALSVSSNSDPFESPYYRTKGMGHYGRLSPFYNRELEELRERRRQADLFAARFHAVLMLTLLQKREQEAANALTQKLAADLEESERKSNELEAHAIHEVKSSEVESESKSTEVAQ